MNKKSYGSTSLITRVDVNKVYEIKFDGASRSNPGPSASSFVVYDRLERVLYSESWFIGTQVTNNEAEYQALIFALKWLRRMMKESPPLTNGLTFQMRGDSLLVINQMIGLYKVKAGRLKELNNLAKRVQGDMRVSYSHIPRERNKLADTLCNQILDKKGF